ncbi:division/cell wall cluster transcriptional repressor MraZ [Sphingomonas sp. RB3P16]|uniref:division/cell wall cluster transcriptional repressor MraZ n=1 Tax=Parasphingomonas frigoris TaxID=3096163 RepID=UPI002FC5DF26
MEELFIGSAICDVEADGEILLPKRFFETVCQRTIDPVLFVGLHEESPCLVVFDRRYAMQHQFEVAERLARSPGGFQDHHRMRRTYGFVAETPIARDGTIVLPPVMRARGAIGERALLVAAGDRFELWDLDGVLDDGPSDLITLARLLLDQNQKDEFDVTSLPTARSRTRANHSTQSRVRLQPLPAVSPRRDPVGGLRPAS